MLALSSKLLLKLLIFANIITGSWGYIFKRQNVTKNNLIEHVNIIIDYSIGDISKPLHHEYECPHKMPHIFIE